MICAACGREIDEKNKYCKYCGAPVKTITSNDAGDVVICKGCGAPIKKGLSFCTQCGTPVNGTAVGAYGKPQQQYPSSSKGKRNNGKAVIAVLTVVAILLLGSVAYYYVGQSGLPAIIRDKILTISGNPKASSDESDHSGQAAEPESKTNDETNAEEPIALPDEEAAQYRQVLSVKSRGSIADVTLYQVRDGENLEDGTALCSMTAYIGSNGVSYNKREGDKCTPAGQFNLLYYITDEYHNRKYALDRTKMPGVLIPEAGDTWVCNPDSPYYNTLQNSAILTRDDMVDSENMKNKFANDYSAACLVFDYNGDGKSTRDVIPGLGSDIFIDGVGSRGNLKSGYGDIKITEDNMIELLSHLDIDLQPIVIIE